MPDNEVYKVVVTDAEGNVMTGYIKAEGRHSYVRAMREEYGAENVSVQGMRIEDLPEGVEFPE